MPEIKVKSERGEYPVMIGRAVSRQMSNLARKACGTNKLFVIYDATVYALHGKTIRKALKAASASGYEMVLPSGEKYKTSATLASIYDFLLDQKIARSDLLLAVGGGVTTDLVGYAAATTLRGVRWGAVPTTLLGMVDAAIGGKTGINHSRGKNLIGAFWPPLFVASDVNLLATLEPRHMVAGMGEIIKCAGLSGLKATRLVQAFLSAGDLYDLTHLTPLIRQSAELKARIVSRDERESGSRLVLNFGHTFAHAIELSLGFGRLLHGEAVILGLHAARSLGALCGPESPGLSAFGGLINQSMRLIPRRKLHSGRILQAMGLDKKRSSRGLRFVLLERPGKPIIYDNVDPRWVKTAVESMLEAYGTLGGKDAPNPRSQRS